MKKIIEIDSGRIDKFKIDIRIPQYWDEEKIVIGYHGFDSSKDDELQEFFGEKLEEKGVALAKFNLPYHGERRKRPEDFTIENCLQDMETVENKLKILYPKINISAFGSSFGAYLILLKIKKKTSRYLSIVLKSPAIKMDKIFKDSLINDNIETLKETGYTFRYKNKPMKLFYEFYRELIENKIFEQGKYEEDILILHGTNDNKALFKDVIEFAKKNRKIQLYSFEGESHRMSDDNIKKVYDIATDYFYKMYNIKKIYKYHN